jgi:hypothetical protein
MGAGLGDDGAAVGMTGEDGRSAYGVDRPLGDGNVVGARESVGIWTTLTL